MLDSPTRAWLDDFSSRYSGTWCWYVDGDKRMLVRITHVGNERVTFEDIEGWKYSANVDSGVLFEFSQVPSGWYVNKKLGPILFVRRPARQWKRGICDQNTSCYSINTNGGLRLSEITGDSLSSLENAGKTDISVLSKWFCVHRSILYCLDTVIGVKENNKIILSEPRFRQELTDAVRRSGNTYEVV